MFVFLYEFSIILVVIVDEHFSAFGRDHVEYFEVGGATTELAISSWIEIDLIDCFNSVTGVIVFSQVVILVDDHGAYSVEITFFEC